MDEIRDLPSWLRYGVMSAIAGTALANIGLYTETPIGIGGLFPILALAVSDLSVVGSSALLDDPLATNLIMAGFWFIIGALLWKFESAWIAFGIWIVAYVAATLTVWFFALG
jgi:hypothetical protein